MARPDRSAARISLWIGFTAFSLLTSSCNRIASSETRELRRSIATNVVLLQPSGRGYVVNRFGDVGAAVDVGAHNATVFTPDLRRAMRARILESSAGRVFELQLAEATRVMALFRMPIGDDVPRWTVRWGSPSGDPALIQFSDELFLRCSSGTHPIKLADEVVAFDVVDTEIMLLTRSAKGLALTTNRLEGAHLVEMRRLSISPGISEVRALSTNKVVLISTSDDGMFKTGISLIDLTNGAYTKLSTSSSGKILDIVPLRGTANLLIDEWNGDERVDGTILSDLYVLNAETARRTWIWSTYKDELVQELPANTARLTCK